MSRQLILTVIVASLPSAAPKTLLAQRNFAAGQITSVDRDSIEKVVTLIVAGAHFKPVSFDGRTAWFRRLESSSASGLETRWLNRELSVTFTPRANGMRIVFGDQVSPEPESPSKLNSWIPVDRRSTGGGTSVDQAPIELPQVSVWRTQSRSRNLGPELIKFLEQVQAAFPEPPAAADSVSR
ncbi:MAG: hypothetical protein ABI765_18160 [Gemmatimonadota bacterium]